ncbi:MAG: O-antigen ligase family protein [Gemmatimonadales bacterium]
MTSVGFAPSRRTTDVIVVVTAVLLLLSTVQGLGAERGTIASAGAVDPLAIFKIGVRLLALGVSGYLWWASPGSLRANWFGPTGWFLAFFAVAALTAFVSANPFVSASRAVSFGIVLVFATSAAAGYVRQGRVAAYWRGVCLLILTTTVPIFAVVLWRGRVVEWYDTVARLGGVYQPNQLGALAAITLVICLMGLRRGRMAPLSLSLFPVALGVGVYTLSRGSWIAMVVGLLAAWWSVRRLRIWTVPVLGLLVTGTLLAVATGFLEPDRGIFAAVRRGQSSTELRSGTGRTGLYSYMLERQFPQRPLLGFGFQMLSDEDVAGDPEPHRTGIARDLGWPAEQGHNLFLSTLIGTGLIGLSLFLVALGSLLWRVARAARGGDPISADQLVLLAVILAHAMVDTTLVTGVDHAFLVLCAMAGLVSARLAFEVQAAPAPAPLQPAARRTGYALAEWSRR